MDFPSKEELSKMVNVKADVNALWDGKEYDLSQGAEVMYGVVHHWKSVHSDVSFNVEQLVDPEIPRRDVENPLTENKGEAFSGLKRQRKPRGEA